MVSSKSLEHGLTSSAALSWIFPLPTVSRTHLCSFTRVLLALFSCWCLWMILLSLALMTYLIRLANSSEAFSVDTPLEVNVKYLKDKVDILPKLTLNWRLEEIPIYLTITRPDISFAVHTVTNLWMLLVIFIWWLSATLLDILLGLSSWSILS